MTPKIILVIALFLSSLLEAGPSSSRSSYSSSSSSSRSSYSSPSYSSPRSSYSSSPSSSSSSRSYSSPSYSSSKSSYSISPSNSSSSKIYSSPSSSSGKSSNWWPSSKSESISPKKYGSTSETVKPSSSTGFSWFGKSNSSDTVSKSMAKENSRVSYRSYLENRDTKKDKKFNPATDYRKRDVPKSVITTPYNPEENKTRRTNYYITKNYNPPIYAQSSPSHFGMWDGMMMWMMLDSMNRNNARMFYNHQDDPGFREFRREADKQAVDNQELKQKLAALDAEVKGLKGEPIQAGYIPPDIDPDIALNPEALKTIAPKAAVITPVKSGKEDEGFGWGKFFLITITLSAIGFGVWWYFIRVPKVAEARYRI